MKRLYPLIVFGLMFHYLHAVDHSSLLIIDFAQTPAHEEQHNRWNAQLHEMVDELNEWLKIRDEQSWLKRFKVWVDATVFGDKAQQRPSFFYARFDHYLGVVALHVPSTVSRKQAVKKVQECALKRQLPINVTFDRSVCICRNPDIGLEGYSLSLDALERLKKGEHLKEQHGTTSEEEIKKALFWFQELPTVGLRTSKPTYPFLPHFFSLWQLAPSKGKGVRVAIVDTGVAAFPISSTCLKNYDLLMDGDFCKHNYNVVSSNGLDPLEQLIHKLRAHMPSSHIDATDIEQRAPVWIRECLEQGTCNGIKDYLGNSTHVDEICAYIKHSFTIVHLDAPYNKKVITQFLPAVTITDEKTTFVAGHGSHSFGIIAGQLTDMHAHAPDNDIGICGLAPAAHVIMIKAFKDDGESNKSTLIAGLKKAITYDADIVNLSLKIADKVNVKDSSTQLLDRLLGTIPYVVAASGNGRGEEAYPARFDNVTFDVGAFRYKDDTYPIVSFSQFKKNYGPKFVAPGYNILSSGLVPSQQTDSMYVFMSGTSMACSITTGFLTLVLGEFKHDFTEAQIDKVIYKSTVRMHNNDQWKAKTLLGTSDMRTALFILHVLKAIKIKLNDNNRFNELFDNCVQATHYFLFSMAQNFSNAHLGSVNMQDEYATFIQKAQQVHANNDPVMHEVTKLAHGSVQHTADIVADIMLAALNDAQVTTKLISEHDYRYLKQIMHEASINMFNDLNPVIQQRLVKRASVDHYWKTQACKLKACV